jgi:long-chain acyl-CoA synthetase
MAAAMLSRGALRQVLQSLFLHERAAARGRRGRGAVDHRRLPVVWPDGLRLDDHGESSLGCDSLEILQLAAAANEMFHLYEGGHDVGLLEVGTFGEWLDQIEAAAAHANPCITFLSSGSTGVPKKCRHTSGHLSAEAAFLARRFSDRHRIVALAPAHHIYGCIFTALLPAHLGVEVWPAERASPGELARGLRPGDLVVSFPERWAWLNRSLPEWPQDVVGVTSTAPCPPGLIASLLQQGLAGMAEVYGSSETAGIALRDDPAAPYRLMPQWRLAGAAGSEFSALLHISGLETKMPDRIASAGERLFHLAGRIDGALQVGGVNVYPARIAALLAECKGVRAAVVRLTAPEQGSRLKAFIVPDLGVDLIRLEDDIEAWSVQGLSAAERPISFTFGKDLPLTDFGKPDDW